MSKTPIVISLGGSLVVPDELNVRFLKKFRTLILQLVKRGQRFILIVGGGKVARRYQAAARQVTKLTPDDLDWLGIHATRLNAHLLRTLFRDYAHPLIITSKEKINAKIRSKIIVAAGFRPGSSTDYDAVLLAKAFGAQTILNLSNIDYVYDADPRKHPQAKPLKKLDWRTFTKLVGTTWDPGANVPFDPVASKWAAKWGMHVVITRGTNFANLRSWLGHGKGTGTVISQ